VPASLAGGLGATLTNGGETLHAGSSSVSASIPARSRLPHNVFLRGRSLPPGRPLRGVPAQRGPGVRRRRVSGNRLPYAPRGSLTVATGYTHPRGLTAQVEAVHTGEQFADDLNRVASSADGQRGLVPAHTICNVAVSWTCAGSPSN